MMKKQLKKILSCIMAVCLAAGIFSGGSFSVRADAAETSGSYNFANVVLFVDFQDTDHSGHTSNLGQCFLKDTQYTFDMFDGSEEKPRGLSYFLSKISYGKLRVKNIFPQYDKESNTIVPYQLSANASAYFDNDGLLAGEAITKLKEAGGDSLTEMDLTGDGVIDNLTIVVPCEEGTKNSRFISHKSSYGGDDRVGGKLVRNVNVLPESGMYLGTGGSGLAIHEFLHSVGYPDLYRQGSSGDPVGLWDIMAKASFAVQYPLAWLRGGITGWFRIPTVTESRTGYSLYAADAATDETKDRQAVILKTDYSDTEFFVLEYRRKSTDIHDIKEEYLYNNSKAYDYYIPGSGLIVYRVDTARESNGNGPPDMIYVFRPGDSRTENRHEAGAGDLKKSFLSAESGRTSYGSGDFGKSLEDGAITYSDGTNSGIVISNVGSARGEQITFDITFHDPAQADFWKSAAEHGEKDTYGMDSLMDESGVLYFLMRKNNTSNGSAYLYRYDASGWTRMGSALTGIGYGECRLLKYNGSFYAAYISGTKAALARYTGSGWQNVFCSSTDANEVNAAADDTGITLACVSMNCTKVYAYKYDGTSAAALGSIAAQSSYASNLSVAAENGMSVLMYREYQNGNKICIKTYQSGKDTWTDVGSLALHANSGLIRLHQGKLYFLKNGDTDFRATDSYLYVCDPSDGEWSQVGNGVYTTENVVEADLVFLDDSPYIVYLDGKTLTTMVHLQDGAWTSLGQRIVSETISGLRAYTYDGQMIVTYASSTSHQVFVKSHGEGSYSPPVTVPVPTPSGEEKPDPTSEPSDLDTQTPSRSSPSSDPASEPSDPDTQTPSGSSPSSGSSESSAPSTPVSTPTVKQVFKAGQTYTVGKYRYRIISPKTNGKGTVAFAGITAKLKKVTIPSTVKIKGKKFLVTQVADKALKNRTTVTSVVIGANVKTIGKQAFYGTKRLKTIQIKSKKLTKIGSKAFRKVYKRAKYKLPKLSKSKKKKYQKMIKKAK